MGHESHRRKLLREASEAAGRWSAAVVAAEVALEEYRAAHNAVLEYDAKVERKRVAKVAADARAEEVRKAFGVGR
jgi:hypothetical protein